MGVCGDINLAKFVLVLKTEMNSFHPIIAKLNNSD